MKIIDASRVIVVGRLGLFGKMRVMVAEEITLFHVVAANLQGDTIEFCLRFRQGIRKVARGNWVARNSVLTLLEVLVVPYRSGDHLLAGRYEALLTQSRGVHVADIFRDHLRAAAQLRAATGVKTPDSLQVVAALAVGCTAFLTNDRDLPTIPGLRILQLSSYVR